MVHIPGVLDEAVVLDQLLKLPVGHKEIFPSVLLSGTGSS